MYYLKTRYYDPQIGRFVSMDDVAYIDPETIGGTNLFAYCNNNPVMNVDPNGNFFFSFLIAIGIGAIIGFTGTVVEDYVDDGEVFNGSVGWQQYLGNTFIGAGVGFVVGLGGQAIIGGLISVGRSLVADSVLSLVSHSNRFSSWQDYAVSFVYGGLTRYGAKNPGKIRSVMSKMPEWIVTPVISQSAEYVFEGESFSPQDVITRIILNGMFEFIKMDFKSGTI